MSTLPRKLTIYVTNEGLVLQPRTHGHGCGSSQRHGNRLDQVPTIRMGYGTSKISPLSDFRANRSEKTYRKLEAYGLVGVLSVSSSSFLIAITRRRQIARIRGKPVYAITGVCLIPAASREDADRAVTQVEGENNDQDRGDSDDDGSGEGINEGDNELVDAPEDVLHGEDDWIENRGDNSLRSSTSHPQSKEISFGGGIIEDVIGRKIRFGRLAAGWLSRRSLGLSGVEAIAQESMDIPLGDIKAALEDSQSFASIGIASAEMAAPASAADNPGETEAPSRQIVELIPKLLRYAKLLFSSQNFFFSYDYDLTRQVMAQEPHGSYLPLHRMTDPLYFWNKNLMIPFINADAHSFILPLIQGFVGQREFAVSPHDSGPGPPTEETPDLNDRVKFLLTLVSRRSVKRPGLRYLRRGVDDDGNAANSVETEQILSASDWDPSRNVYSYVQIRGSIPLYFSQSPYSLKPTPVLHYSAEANKSAFNKHFRSLSRRYGKIQAVSLVDKHGSELKLGEEYKKYAEALGEGGEDETAPIKFEWFDFHSECRGMKFENVTQLVKRAEETLHEFGYSIYQDGLIVREQKGVVRTNCMDCLDRTGVAQCAFGQWALERELDQEGVDVDLGAKSATLWFNALWADNGDAISKQYSSTAALKGDYTRTRKRDYRGALNDFGLTLSRYFNNMISDYFSQACIDYLLGNVSIHIFDEFAVELQSVDPGISLQRLRQNAIDASCRIVISEQTEELLGGWTMLTPHQPNTLRTLPFEESVFLLTDAAVYVCRFDWSTDEVLSFERIALRSILRLTLGTYITSVFTESQTNPATNVGIVITYRATIRDGDNSGALNVNTRSLQSQDARSSDWDIYSWLRGLGQSSTRFMALKALPLSISAIQGRDPNTYPTTERILVRNICEDIERAVVATGRSLPEGRSLIEEADVISRSEAGKHTGYLETLVYDVKKLVWA